MNFFTTGIDTVDQMGRLSYTGNIKPPIWNKTIVNEKGKPQRLAMDILADVAYWYKPTEVRDEISGQVIGWKKKFASDLLQRGYKELEEQFGEEKRTIMRALAFLEELGVVRRVFRTIKFKNGMINNNVMFLELNPYRLYQLTYPEKEEINVSDQTEKYNDCSEYEILEEEKSEEMLIESGNAALWTEMTTPMDKNDYPYGQICPQGTTKMSTGGDKFVERVWTDVSTGYDKNVHTNTKNTTENTDRDLNTNHIQSIRTYENELQEMTDGIDKTKVYMDLIRRNLELDVMLESVDCSERDNYEEMYNLICDIVCVPRKTVRVSGEEYPYELVKSRFLKLKFQHLEYVAMSMREQTTKIGNIKAYMITALYNAPNTITYYYQQKVAYDLYGQK